MGKREVSPQLKAILEIDVALTNKFCSFLEQFSSFRSLRVHYKTLEVSCHGIPWFVCWLAYIWITSNPSLYQMQVNFFLGLVLDVIIVGVLKAVTRRRRPTQNKPDMFATMGPDVFSFPSGHATRCVFITTFFIYLFPVSLPFRLPLLAWSFAVSVSRVMLRRHHLLDVTAGVLIGIAETFLISILWLGQDSSVFLLSLFGENSNDDVV